MCIIIHVQLEILRKHTTAPILSCGSSDVRLFPENKKKSARHYRIHRSGGRCAQRSGVQARQTSPTELQGQITSPLPHVQLDFLSIRIKACISSTAFQSAFQILQDEVTHPDQAVCNIIVAAAQRTGNTSSILRALRAFEAPKSSPRPGRWRRR
mmetsp:Transcript_26519/g.66463  ORF Transcript_26519/g.66463 Transcript_26519/m.66463 type:complete len:154 (-) Transcript_26519:379-840(-)